MTTEIATTDQPQEVNLLSIIANAAANPAVDVDKLERLLAMQQQVMDQAAERVFNAAMLDAQEAIRPVVANKKNKQTSSTYADLEQISKMIDPLVRSHGFSMSFGTETSPLDSHYRVTCAVSHTGGFTRNYHVDVPVDNKGPKGEQNKTMTHGFGSALSYGRRYLKMLIFDIKTTDDDGNAAGNGELVNEEQIVVLNGLADAVGADKQKACELMGVDSFADIRAIKYNDAVELLSKKNRAAAKQYLTGGK